MKKIFSFVLGCLMATGMMAQGANEAYTVFDGTNKLTFYYDDQRANREGTVELLSQEDRLTSYAYQVTWIVIDNSFKDYELTSTSSLFNNAMMMTFLDKVTNISYLWNINTAAVTDMSCMFQGMRSMTSLELTDFNTENVTTMSDMFSDCQSLKCVNLRSFDTKNVTDMSYMFYGCSSLANVDMSRFDFSKVETTKHMFYNCMSLKYVNMCNAHPNAITNTIYMFFGCGELETIYCEEDWTTKPSLTHQDGMFYECNKLSGEIGGRFSHKPAMTYALFDGKNTMTYYNNKDYDRYRTDILCIPITRDQYMDFQNFSGEVTKIIIDPSVHSSALTSSEALFYLSEAGQITAFSKATKIAGLENINTKTMTSLRNLFSSMHALQKIDLSVMDLSPVTETSDMFYYCDKLTTIYCSQDLSAIPADKSLYMFANCPKLVGGSGTAYDEAHKDASYARPDGGVSKPGYFTTPPELYGVMDGTTLTIRYDTDKAKNDGVSNWWDDYSISSTVTEVVFDESCDAARPTSTARWFLSFMELQQITGLEYLHTDNVTDMRFMFGSCTKLPELDLSHFNTGNVTDMSNMFNDCYLLGELDLRSFNTEKVTVMNCMFDGCKSLKTLRLGENFKTGNVTGMYLMFRDCKQIAVFPIKNFVTSKVTSMMGMFEGCSLVGNLDLSNFNTANVKDMSDMFRSCENLTTLNIASFDMSNVTNATKMFYDCGRLKYIVAGGWSTLEGLASSTDMFTGCVSLKGDKGTTYDEGHTDRSWARQDGGAGKEGYFCFYVPAIYALPSDENKTLTLYYGPDWSSKGGVDWRSGDFHETVTKIVLDPSIQDARPATTSNWFYTFDNLEEFVHLDYLNTEAVTDMEGMFSQCHSLTSLDLSNFKTGNVTNMRRLFEGCGKLESVALNNFDTRNVTRMSAMFYFCSSLTSLELFSFNTGNVTDMHAMFDGCRGLKILDVTKFDTRNVTNMSGMFYGCETLTTLDIRNFNIDKVTDMSEMFEGCKNLAYIVCDKDWSESKVESDEMFMSCFNLRGEAGTKYDHEYEYEYNDIARARPDGGEGNEGYFCTHVPELYCYVNNDGKTMTLYYDTRRELNDGDTFWADEKYRNAVTEIYLDSSMVYYRPHDMSFFFSSFKELQKIEHLDYLNTSDVVNMMMAFEGCAKLESLDLSHFNTRGISSFALMFKGCTALKSLDLTAFDFSNATDLTEMFSGCTALETVDLRTWYGSAGMPLFAHMFEGCSALKNIYWFADWTKLDPSYAEDMFKGCTSLKGDKGTAFSGSHIDNSWARFDDGEGKEGYFRLYDGKEAYKMYDDSKKTLSFHNDNLRYFNKDVIYEDINKRTGYESYVHELTKVVFEKDFAEVRPASTYAWFAYFDYLETIEGLEYLNTSEVTNMGYMFTYDDKLTELDLTHFDMSKVTNVACMFYDCDKLKTIRCNEDWSTMAHITGSDYLFGYCDELVGGKGTVFDKTNPVDKTYARPDRGEKAPGYFTGKLNYHVTLVAENGQIAVKETGIDLNAVPDETTLHLTVTPEYGYNFSEWKNYDPEKGLVVTSDTTVTALFAPQTFTLTVKVEPAEGGIAKVDGLSKSNTGPYMTEFTLEAIPNEGYEFDAWYKGEMKLENAEAKTSSVLFGDMTMTCTFKLKTYKVVFLDWNGNELKSENVEHGKSATAPENPTREGYTFTGWDKKFDNITGDLTVTAQYEEAIVIDYTPKNLQAVLEPKDDDVQITLSWDKVEGVVSYELRVTANGNELFSQNTMTLNVIARKLSDIEKDYKLIPGTYTIDWFVRSTDAMGVPLSDWAQGESFEVTVKDPATGIDAANSQEPTANSQKLLINGQLYIMYKGTMYNVQGKMVK